MPGSAVNTSITDAPPQCDRFFHRSAILMAAQVLPSSPPLSSLLPLPLPRRSHCFRLLHHTLRLASAAVVLPLQLGAAWIARPDASNRMAVSLLGSG